MFKMPAFWLLLFGCWLFSAVVPVLSLLVSNSWVAAGADSPVVAAMVFGLMQIGGLVAGAVLYRRRALWLRVRCWLGCS